jgi:hypothetical protein
MNKQRKSALKEFAETNAKLQDLRKTSFELNRQSSEFGDRVKVAREELAAKEVVRDTAIRTAARAGDLNLSEDARTTYREAERQFEELEGVGIVVAREAKTILGEIRVMREEVAGTRMDVARTAYPGKLAELQKATSAMWEAWTAYNIWHGSDGGSFADWLERSAFPPNEEEKDKAVASLFDRSPG